MSDYIKGGSFLIQDTDAADVFTYEDFDSDQLMFAKTAKDFMDNEVLEVSDEIEAKNFEVSVGLFRLRANWVPKARRSGEVM